MSKYTSILKIRFIHGLQYRTAALAGISTQFAWGFMEILAFLAFYKGNPDNFPMEIKAVVSYIWIQQAFLAVTMSWFLENDIYKAVSEGNIAYELVRPMDLYGKWFFQSCGSRLAKVGLRFLPIIVVASLLPENIRLSAPADLLTFLLFILSMIFTLLVVVAYNMIIYVAVIHTISPNGIRAIGLVIADFLSGAIIPLPFFPEQMRKIVELTPFAAMQNTTLRIYTGDIPLQEAYGAIGLQVFWIIVLVALGKAFMSFSEKRVVVQGG